MNKYIIFGCISIFSLFNVQCSFLDEKPIDRLVVDNFYTSQKDAQAQLMQLINNLIVFIVGACICYAILHVMG